MIIKLQILMSSVRFLLPF